MRRAACVNLGRAMLIALPAELLVQVLACLAAAADFARAAMSCTACHNALERAARAHVLGRGLPPSEARPWLQLSPFKRIRVPWTFLLRVAEVRPRVLEAVGPKPSQDLRIWFYGKHDAPTAWCIANEQRIIADEQRAAAEEAARVEQAAARAAETAWRAAREEAARERARARMAALKLAKKDMAASSDSEDDDDW